MIYSVTIQPDAEVELDEIYAYVACQLRNSVDAARLIDRLETAMPYRSTTRPTAP